MPAPPEDPPKALDFFGVLSHEPSVGVELQHQLQANGSSWLPVMGPTTTWLYRRLGSWAEFNPEGVTVDTVDLSTSMGLGESLARNAGIARAIGRLIRFDAARWQADELHVRTALAPRSYKNATPEGLEDLKQHWGDSELDARRRVFATRLNVFTEAQAANESKAQLLQAAIVVEVLGVAAVGIAVLVIVTQG